MNRYLESSYRFGLIGGAFSILAFVVFYLLGQDPTNLSLVFGYIILPAFIFVGIRYFRKTVNDDMLSFAHGMTIGFLIYCIIGIMSGLGIFLILLIVPGLFDMIKANKIAVLEENKDLIISQLNEESFNITFESILAMSAWDVAFNDFIWKILPGLFFTIIISIILRKT